MIFDRKALLFVTCSAGVFFRAAAAAEGKGSKGTKSQSNPVPTLYFLNPSSCPQDCVQCTDVILTLAAGTPPQDDGHGTGEAVQPCNAENKHQMWRLHQKDGLTMIESYFNPGDCLAVVPRQDGGTQLGHGVLAAAAAAPKIADKTIVLRAADMGLNTEVLQGHNIKVAEYMFSELMDPTMVMNRQFGSFRGDGWVVDDMCNNGSVGLVSCNNPAAQWIVNGANLISALCWKNGISSFMAVNEECSELSVMAADGGNDALLRSQTFLLTEQDFIETIVPVPTDEGEPGDLDPSLGSTIPSDLPLLQDLKSTMVVFDQASVPATGALLYPDYESGSVVEAKCDSTCENGKVCAKYPSTEAGGECYTKCDDVKCDSDTQGETCVQSYSDETGIITSDCDCEKAADGKGGYLWMCKAY